MNCPQAEFEEEDCPSPEEFECKICYQRYNANNRKPKILDCLHRFCTRCLIKILDITDGAGFISCPLCRHQTEIIESELSALPDDDNIISHLVLQSQSWCADNREVVLTPESLSSSPSQASSNCLVITIMEVQRDSPSQNSSSDFYAEPGLNSDPVGSNGPPDQDDMYKFCNHVPRILVWLLGFSYFGSLPLGIYLLVIQRVTLGIVCVSLVPSSLTVCLVYGFCQCLCQGMCDCSSRG